MPPRPLSSIVFPYTTRFRSDLLVETPRRLRRRGALLRLEGIFVLCVASNLVALGDDLGGLDHCHVKIRPVLDQPGILRSEEHTSELQSRQYLVCRLLLEKRN